MAIAFYCEEEDPKVYYDSYGYNSSSGNFHQLQQSQHAVAATGSHPQAGASGIDENNNNSSNSGSNNNCALHGSSDIVNNRQLMRVVLHQVLYRCTMEGALSPAHTSCVFCNKIYYLFQLLY